MLYASNPRRRRRRSRRRHSNARRMRWFNRRGRRRYSRRRRRNPVSYNRRHRRRGRRRNPGLAIRGRMGQVFAGFSPTVLMKALPVAGGAIGNAFLSGFLSSRLPLPGFLKAGPGAYVTSLASAGLLGAGVGMVAPRFGPSVFFGGVLETVIRAMNEFVVRRVMSGLGGFGDYLTVGDAAAARPLYGLSGMGYTGDYLTVGDAARARPLYGLGATDEAVSEELAAL